MAPISAAAWNLAIIVGILSTLQGALVKADASGKLGLETSQLAQPSKEEMLDGITESARGALSYCGRLLSNSTADATTLFLDRVGQSPAELGRSYMYSSDSHNVLLDTNLNNSAWQLDWNGFGLVQWENLGEGLTYTRQVGVDVIYLSPQEQCYGLAGPVIHDEKIYCNRMGTNALMVYDLRTRTVVNSQPIPDAGNYSYAGWYRFGFMDVMTDQQGFWAVYGSQSRNGQLTIQKFDPVTLMPLGTWYTEKQKDLVGNSIMIDGILYVTDKYTAVSTVDYAYSTISSRGTAIDDADLSFNNLRDNLSVDYNMRLNLLISWQSSFYLSANSVHLRTCTV